MKRISRVLFLVLTCILLFSTVALAAYSITITATETGSNNYSMLPMIAEMNNSYMANQFYIEADGLDTRVLLGSNPVPHMVASDRTMFAAPISALSLATFRYTTANSDLVSMPVIVGRDGVLTIADHADLELGSQFSVTIDGYFDTSAAMIGENILYKLESFRIYVQAEGVIRAAILEAGDAETKYVDGTVASGEHEVEIYTSGSTLSFGLDGSRIAHTHLDTADVAGVKVADSASVWRGEGENSGTHHSFFATGRYWVFWGVSGHTYYNSSVDGVTWTASVEAVSKDIAETTFITDGTNVYEAYREDDDGIYRKGVCNSDGSISWGSISAITGTTNHLQFGSSLNLALDSNGDVYCVFSNNDDSYFVYLDKCLGTSSAWSSISGYPTKSGLDGGNDPTMITALGNGSIYVTWSDYGQLWSGSSWGGVEDVGAASEYGDLLAYGNTVYWYKQAHQLTTTHKVFTRTYGVGWDVGTDLSRPAGSSTTYLGGTISIDESTGDLYVFHTDTTLDKVYYKKYDADTTSWSANWTELSDETVDTIYFVSYSTHIDSFPSTGNGGQVGVLYNTLTAGVGKAIWKYANVTLNDNPVPDTANDYVLMDANTMPYADSVDFTIAGTQTLLYQPITIVSNTGVEGTADSGSTTTIVDAILTQGDDYWNGARLIIADTTDHLAPKGETAVITNFDAASDELTFAALTVAPDAGDTYTIDFGTVPDRAGTAQNGRITWGVNPVGVALTITQTTIPDWTSGGGGGVGLGPRDSPDIVPPVMGQSSMFGMTAPTNVLTPVVNIFATLIGLNAIYLWIMFALLLTLVVVGGAYVLFHDEKISAIGGGLAIGMFVAMGALPWWMLGLCVLDFVLLIIMWRTSPA